MIDSLNIKNKDIHFPVMIREIIEYLNIQNNKSQTFLDCTFGVGGYSRSILQNSNSSNVIAVDRDEMVLPYVNDLQKEFPNRFSFHQTTFSNFPEALSNNNIDKLDGIVMDLGFSSLQMSSGRGFSFNDKESFSMGMGLNNTNAEEFINTASNQLLSDVFYHYGEERKAHQIANLIVKIRENKKITNSFELANIVRKVVGYKSKTVRTDPVTKTFQAIRIYINDELHELEKALDLSLSYLKPSGRLVIVSFHSLEDRIVKKFMQNNGYVEKKFTKNKPDQGSIKLKIITNKPILPQEDEIKANSPSNSAKLRCAERV